MSDHTKGKLVCRGYSIYAADQKTPVADTCLTASAGPDCDHANARRLVACWNACEGISTDELESEKGASVGWARTASKLLKATTQRDKLLAALKAIEPHIPTTSASEGGAAKYSAHVQAADLVRAAIKESEGS